MQQEGDDPVAQIQAYEQQLKGNGASCIGAGYQGIVYSYDLQAHKIINHNASFWRSVLLPLFQNEIRFIKQLSIGVCSIVPPFRRQNDQCYWFSTALMNKGNLWNAMRISDTYEDLNPQLIFWIFFEIRKILNFLHPQKIYHYDIKPANILLNYGYGVYMNSNRQAMPFEEAIQKVAHQLLGQRLEINQIEELLRLNQMDYVMQQSILQIQCHEKQEMQFSQIRLKEHGEIRNQYLAQLLHLVAVVSQRHDFHPDNIFIKHQLQLVLCDFGFASQELKKDGRGTELYRAPFQILKPQFQGVNEQEIAKQCDLFSFGMTIFHLLWKSQNIQLTSQYSLTEIKSQILLQEIRQQNPGFQIEQQPPDTMQHLYLYWNVINSLREYHNNGNFQAEVNVLIRVILKLVTFNFTNSDNQNDYATEIHQYQNQIEKIQQPLLQYIEKQ